MLLKKLGIMEEYAFVAVCDGAETAVAALFVYDALLHAARPVCRKDARISVPQLEEPHQGA